MRYEYASVRYVQEEPLSKNLPDIYIKTPYNQYKGTLNKLYEELKLEGDPSLIGIFNYLGEQGWRLLEISKDNMYFFERKVE